MQPTVDALNKEVTRTTVELNNTKLYVTSIEQELETVKQAKDAGDVTNKELRALNIKQLNEISRIKAQIDTLIPNIPNNGKIIIVHDTIKSGYLGFQDRNAYVLPFGFNKTDKWMTLAGEFDAQGKLGISLKMDVPIDVWTGISKETKKPTANVSTFNPYIRVMSINSIKMDTYIPKKFTVSIFAGYGVCKTGLSPVVAIGCGRTIFGF